VNSYDGSGSVDIKAQRWHEDAGHGNWEPYFSTCFCCCPGCDPDYVQPGNPHYAAAQAAYGKAAARAANDAAREA
jgi:hypothetical protein